MNHDYRLGTHIVKNIKKCVSYVNNMSKNERMQLLKFKENQISDASTPMHNITFLGKGGQGIVYLLHSDDCGDVVFKISSNNDETKREIFFLNKVKELIDNNVSPNFIYNYNNILLENKYYIFNEYAEGTLEQWMENDHSTDEWDSFMFQILYAVFIMQNKLKMYHADLKPKNILYKNIKKGYFKYILNDEVYYVPTYGNLFIISDFGKSQSLLLKNNTIDDTSIQTCIDENLDLEHISSLPKRIIVSALEKKYKYDNKELINIIKKHSDTVFDMYYESEKKKINYDLEKYPEFIKKKMLLRSIIYYAIEKDYIDVATIPKDLFTMKYPPITTNKKIEHIFSSHKKIIELLKLFKYNNLLDNDQNNYNIIATFNYNKF